MSSSRKTEHLGLNQWDGSDSAEREDFNGDNRLIDEAAGALGERLEAAEAEGATAAALSAETLGAVREHAAAQDMHLGEGEKERLLAVEMLRGSYSGNGEARREIELGFRPSFGLVWCASICMAINGTGGTWIYADTLSVEAAGACCETYETGFAVRQASAAVEGYLARLNESGKQYLYVVWR